MNAADGEKWHRADESDDAFLFFASALEAFRHFVTEVISIYGIMKQPTVSCPQCGKIVIWDSGNRYRPFCSERCKLIDLGQWAAESYRIPDDGKQEDEPAKKEREEGAE